MSKADANAQTAQSEAGTINSETAAKLIMCTREWLRRLVKDGWIKKLGKDRFRIVDVVQGYINYLKDENRRTSKSAAQSRVQDARAKEIELRVGREQNQLIEIDDVEAFLSDTIGSFRSELSGLPAACTRDLALRETIEKQLNGTIDRCRRKFEEAATAVRAGREIAVVAEEAEG